MTQSAVSKQIAALQTDPGQPLFQRLHKRIEIAPFGQKVSDLATSSFARIETCLLEMKTAAPDEIRIVMQP